MRNKILYLYQNLNVGGAEQLLLTTLKYLNRDKFYPVVYCLEEKGEIAGEIEKMGIAVKSLQKKPYLWNLGIIQDLVRIFKAERPQILHTHLFSANYFGRIAALFSGIPIVIVTEHGTHSNFKKFYHHGIDFILSFFTTKIIAVSKAVRKYILKHSLISPHKIDVIYNAVDVDRFKEAYSLDRVLIRKRLGFVDSDFLIGCVSKLAPWKGQFFLLQAFSQVIKHFPSAKLCIIGRDAAGLKSRLETFAREKGFLESVYFFGERRDTPEILRALDLFVFPSLTEGLGISLLEAMYMGLPAIASNTEGIKEIIEDNQDGILVPPGNFQALAEKILMLLEDRDKMRRISDNARKKIEKFFLPRNYLEKLELLYG